MSDEQIRERVRARIEPRLGGRELTDDDDMFSLGYVNSLFAMQLARFVEKEFGIRLGPEDMDFDNFRSVRGIVTLIAAKMPAAEQA